MMLIKGLIYQLKGFRLGIKTPRILFLGLLRFLILMIFTIIAAVLVLNYYQDILSYVWVKPEHPFFEAVWTLVSWITASVLIMISTVLSYLVSQIVFSVFIMDMMSVITERLYTGKAVEPENMSVFRYLLRLIRNEIPRTIIPVVLSVMLFAVGWTTPFGPYISVLSAFLGIVFLSWDHTDLVPARRMVTFRERFKFLNSTILFHIGFGSVFLIPVINIFFLVFAPVGATLFYLDHEQEKTGIS